MHFQVLKIVSRFVEGANWFIYFLIYTNTIFSAPRRVKFNYFSPLLLFLLWFGRFSIKCIPTTNEKSSFLLLPSIPLPPESIFNFHFFVLRIHCPEREKKTFFILDSLFLQLHVFFLFTWFSHRNLLICDYSWAILQLFFLASMKFFLSILPSEGLLAGVDLRSENWKALEIQENSIFSRAENSKPLNFWWN